jgi:hypothetical protein
MALLKKTMQTVVMQTVWEQLPTLLKRQEPHRYCLL